jgi:outer membrane protein assembly factor BamB
MNTPNTRQVLRVLAMAVALGTPPSVSSALDVNSCGPEFYAWSPPTTETTAGVASAPASDTLFAPKKRPSTAYLAQGDTLFAIRNVADREGPAGSLRWTWSGSPSTLLPSSPVPVDLSHGGEFVFLTTGDGFLHKIRASDGAPEASRDTRRLVDGAVVCPADRISGSPAVQLYRFSSSGFQSHVNAVKHHPHDDLVFVITRNGCGDTTHNRVIAYWASDLTVAWTFNADGDVKVDGGTEACSVDYATNTLFCGTDLAETASGQDSLFALDTRSGKVVWSTNAGGLSNRPMLSRGRIYVADRLGALQAYDPAGDGLGGGMVLWSSALAVASPGSIVSRNLAPVERGPQNELLVVDSAGVLRLVRDLGSLGTVLWSLAAESGASFVSAPVAAPSLNRAYIGRDDGFLQQISLAGAPQGVAKVNSSAASVGDPSLDVEPGTSAPDRLVVAGEEGRVTRLVLPICDTPPS